MFPKLIIMSVCLALMVFALVYVLPYLFGRLTRIGLARRCRSAGALVLTYDDGPGAVLTPALIDLLGFHQAKATFFCLGMRAVSNTDIMDRLKSEGHEIACHSFRHLNSWKVSPAKAIRDVGEGFEALSKWISSDGLFRPPYGNITLHTWLALLTRKAKAVWWTHDSGDTCAGGISPVEGFVEEVIRDGGGVVLLHDFDRDGGVEADSRREFVLGVTRSLLEKARKAGLEIMTLGELFNHDACRYRR